MATTASLLPATATTRPHSTSFTATPISPHKPTSHRSNCLSTSTPTPKRQPLGAISVQTFQDRHRTEFAHLHTHSNDSLREKRLEAEKAELERARREGREKRESLKAALSAADSSREGKGRRPLSLVVKQSGGTNAKDGGGRGGRPTSAPLTAASLSLSPRASINRDRPGRGSLNVLVESDSRLDLDSPSATADTSISQSSYSWASQFSGETEELRAAARYVPKPDEESEAQEELQDDDEEEVLTEDGRGIYRRRKKIVALAHTVRQLEGVGSREAEDPAFYAVLEKAWNERPTGTAPAHADAYGAASSDNGSSSSPYTPNLSSRHSDNYPSYARDGDGESHISTSSSGGRRSQSVRYSYASTLHDLALDGGIEQANRIFVAKPWLRASIVSTGDPGGFGFGSNWSAKPPPAPPTSAGGYPAGDIRRLSLASAPPPLALQPAENDQQLPTLRKIKGHLDNTASEPTVEQDKTSVDDSESHAETDKIAQPIAAADSSDTTAVEPAGWGLGFVSDWFGGSTTALSASAAAAAAMAAAEPAKAPDVSASLITRSTTVAQFDDAPNDDSLVQVDADADADADAEGETDDGEYESASEEAQEPEQEPEQVFHEREGAGQHFDPSSAQSPRPESTILPSPKSAKANGNINKILDQDPNASSSTVLTDLENENEHINVSPSSNPSQPLICSTHSITSYQPTLVHLPTNLGLGLHLQTSSAVVEEEELLSQAGSCLSLANSSSPSTRKRDSDSITKKPVLAPIQTTLDRLEGGSSSRNNLNLPHDEENKENEEGGLKVHLSDERFSNAYKLAQSIRVPTPSIRSPPIRQSSINAFNFSPAPSPNPNTNPSLSSPNLLPSTNTNEAEMEISSRWFSQDSSASEDFELMMGGAPSPTTYTRPLPPARTRSSSTSIVNSPTVMTPTSPNLNPSSAATAAKSMRRPSRPTLLDTRANTLSSISELGYMNDGLDRNPNALHPSDTLNSISGGSEVLSDLNGDNGIDDPLSASFSNLSMSGRRSRLAKTSLDSLPSHLRPPSISDSFSSSSVGRRGSNYQAYQQRHLERDRRVNARVAAKMAGASQKELKQLQQQQHQSMVLGSGSPNPCGVGGKLESQSILIVPEPSKTAAVLFFLGCVLGPWFWIFGGWMPLGHSSEVRKDEEASLDFTAADHLPRWWRWTYHPDPWVKRNRRAAAVVIPLMLVGGIAAAVAVAVVFGAA